MAKSNTKKRTRAENAEVRADEEGTNPIDEAAADQDEADRAHEPAGLIHHDQAGIEEEYPGSVLPAVAGFAGKVQVFALAADGLHSWTGNGRQQKDPDAIKELKASIRQYGVLTSLVVRPSKEGGYEVLAGGQRLQAVRELIAERAIENADGYMVPCRIVECTDEEAQEISLAENVVRRQLSAADEFEAFHKMHQAGASIADIAQKFGVGESTVKKRLKLANVSPKIMQEFRAGKIELNQLQAFAITDDHKAQEKLAKSGGHTNRPDWIRDQLMKSKTRIPADDDRVKFVGGIAACKAAGIALVEDLFDPEAGYVEDPKALQALVDKTAKDLCDHYKLLGYSTVEFHAKGNDTSELNEKYGYSWNDPKPKLQPMQGEDKINHDNWTAELKRLEKQEDDDGLNEAEDARKDWLEEKIDSLEERNNGFPEKDRKSLSVLIGMGSRGVEIRFVKDKAVEKKTAAEQKAREKTSGKSAKPVKKKSIEQKQHNDGRDENLTLSLMSDITTYRTFGVANALADEPEVAVPALFAALHGRMGCISISLSETTRNAHLQKKGVIPAYDALTEKRKLLDEKVKAAGGAFAWALKASPAELNKGLSILTAQGFSDKNETGRIGDDALKVWSEIDVDLSKHYTPTAKDTFSRVPGEYLKATIKECREARKLPKDQIALTPAEEKLKREGLAQLAEREAAAAAKAGVPWLPHPMRLPETKKPAAKKPAAKAKAKAK